MAQHELSPVAAKSEWQAPSLEELASEPRVPLQSIIDFLTSEAPAPGVSIFTHTSQRAQAGKAVFNAAAQGTLLLFGRWRGVSSRQPIPAHEFDAVSPTNEPNGIEYDWDKLSMDHFVEERANRRPLWRDVSVDRNSFIAWLGSEEGRQILGWRVFLGGSVPPSPVEGPITAPVDRIRKRGGAPPRFEWAALEEFARKTWDENGGDFKDPINWKEDWRSQADLIRKIEIFCQNILEVEPPGQTALKEHVSGWRKKWRLAGN
jgi:hypothetical protein